MHDLLVMCILCWSWAVSLGWTDVLTLQFEFAWNSVKIISWCSIIKAMYFTRKQIPIGNYNHIHLVQLKNFTIIILLCLLHVCILILYLPWNACDGLLTSNYNIHKLPWGLPHVPFIKHACWSYRSCIVAAYSV